MSNKVPKDIFQTSPIIAAFFFACELLNEPIDFIGFGENSAAKLENSKIPCFKVSIISEELDHATGIEYKTLVCVLHTPASESFPCQTINEHPNNQSLDVGVLALLESANMEQWQRINRRRLMDIIYSVVDNSNVSQDSISWIFDITLDESTNIEIDYTYNVTSAQYNAVVARFRVQTSLRKDFCCSPIATVNHRQKIENLGYTLPENNY